jgi:exodeoxyribonuclease VIII
MNVMIDLETMGNSSTAAIIAIGAVEFSKDGLGREFYTTVNLGSAVAAGLTMDASTVLWWMEQSDAARKAAIAAGRCPRPLATALGSLSQWMPVDAEVWGNGATFDNVILTNAYKSVGLTRPWPFWTDRCFRTLKNLYPHIGAPERTGTHHNALDDAKFQALHAIEIFKEMQ